MIRAKDLEALKFGTVNIYDLFDNEISYPEEDEILDGIPVNVNWSYISNTYLNGIINYVDIIGGFMIRRYKSLRAVWEESCKNIDKLKDTFHTNLSNSDEFDDQIILAKGANSYWLFWNDCDCSDCEIGRLSTDHFDSDETALKYLEKSIPRLIYQLPLETDDPLTYMKFIPKEYFSGWKTL